MASLRWTDLIIPMIRCVFLFSSLIRTGHVLLLNLILCMPNHFRTGAARWRFLERVTRGKGRRAVWLWSPGRRAFQSEVSGPSCCWGNEPRLPCSPALDPIRRYWSLAWHRELCPKRFSLEYHRSKPFLVNSVTGICMEDGEGIECCKGTCRLSSSLEWDRSPRMHCLYRLVIHPLCEMAGEDA